MSKQEFSKDDQAPTAEAVNLYLNQPKRDDSELTPDEVKAFIAKNCLPVKDDGGRHIIYDFDVVISVSEASNTGNESPYWVVSSRPLLYPGKITEKVIFPHKASGVPEPGKLLAISKCLDTKLQPTGEIGFTRVFNHGSALYQKVHG